jgi:hypothetical protein
MRNGKDDIAFSKASAVKMIQIYTAMGMKDIGSWEGLSMRSQVLTREVKGL